MSAFAGIVRGKAVDYVWAESPEKGTRYANVRFRIIGGEHDGKLVPWQAYVTANTQERVIESFMACGCTFDDDDITNLDGIDRNEVELDVGIERWNDKKTGEPKERSRVNWVNGSGGVPEDQRLDERKKSQFAQQMKGALKTLKRKSPASPNAPAGNGRSQQQGDDDIPF